MRHNILYILLSLSLTVGSVTGLRAQTPAAADTIYNPTVLFTGLPKTYEIADIVVNGADNYEDYIVIGYSGLKQGDQIEIPGSDISDASKRLWRQGLFSKVQLSLIHISEPTRP